MTFPPTLRVKTLESVAVVNWSFVDVQCGRRTVFPLEQRIWRSSSMWNVQRSKQPTENGKMRRENGKLPIWLHWRYILTFLWQESVARCITTFVQAGKVQLKETLQLSAVARDPCAISQSARKTIVARMDTASDQTNVSAPNSRPKYVSHLLKTPFRKACCNAKTATRLNID